MYTSRVHPTFSNAYPALCVWCVCDGWATLPTSAVTAMSSLWPWAHVSVNKREGDGWGWRDDGNVVSTWSHMAEIEKGEEGRRQWTEVAATINGKK